MHWQHHAELDQDCLAENRTTRFDLQLVTRLMQGFLLQVTLEEVFFFFNHHSINDFPGVVRPLVQAIPRHQLGYTF